MSWIQPAIAAGGAILGGLLSSKGASKGANAQLEAARLAAQVARETNDLNAAIAAQNMAQAAQMMQAQIDMAMLQRNDERLGGFDAFGNRTYWHPERGWVTELTPTQQRIQDASERQQILDRTILDRMERERQGRTQDLQREDYRDAESQRDAFRNVRQPSEQAITDMLFARGEQARSDARDDAMTAMLRTQSRQGNTSNIPKILSQAAGQSADDARTAYVDSMLQGMQASKSIPQGERSHRANMYSIFRDRATQPLGAAVQPAAAAPQFNFPTLTDGGASTALNRNPPQAPYVQPDFSASGIALAEGNLQRTKYDNLSNLVGNLVAATQTDAFGDWLRSFGNSNTSSTAMTRANMGPHSWGFS